MLVQIAQVNAHEYVTLYISFHPGRYPQTVCYVWYTLVSGKAVKAVDGDGMADQSPYVVPYCLRLQSTAIPLTKSGNQHKHTIQTVRGGSREVAGYNACMPGVLLDKNNNLWL